MTYDFAFLVPVLAITTMLVLTVAAMVSKKKTDDRIADDDTSLASFAKDGNPHVKADT